MSDLESKAMAAFDAAEDTSNAGDDTSADDQADTGEETQDTNETKEEESQDESNDESADDSEADNTDEDADAESDDDEAEDDEDEEDDDTADEGLETEPGSIQEYIIERLPTLTVKGKDGKTYNIKVAEELPEDFEFENKRAEMLFTQQLVDQNQEIHKLATEFNNKQAEAQANATRLSDARAVSNELTELQDEGLLPKFKEKVSSTKLQKDPAYLEAQEVFKKMQDMNKNYAKKGLPYRVGLRDALREIQLNKLTEKDQTRKTKATEERKKVASKLAGGGSTKEANVKPRVQRGETISDILDRALETWE
jgi:hypothetical protein